jgi:hypothetical protein
MESNKKTNIMCMPEQMVSDDEQSDNNFEYDKVSLTKESGRFSNEENANECPKTVNFDLDGSTKKSKPIILWKTKKISNPSTFFFWLQKCSGSTTSLVTFILLNCKKWLKWA